MRCQYCDNKVRTDDPEMSGGFPANRDPWRDREIQMKCTRCMWFIEKVPTQGPTNPRIVGRCRRHAPTVGGFPVVYGNDWCGDHRVNEETIGCG